MTRSVAGRAVPGKPFVALHPGGIKPIAEAPSAMQLIGAWDPAGRAPAHCRLAALLCAIDGAAACADDTLGERNRQLLSLHRALLDAPLEARVTCARCGVDSELVVPTDAILALPLPDAAARVQVRSGKRALTFRLPRMADLDAASGASDPDAIQLTLLERCRVDGDGGSDRGAVPDALTDRLARRFEELDPAANIVVNISCSGCARPLAASVDVATFVARDLDRVVDGLYHDIDVIASTYGWDEATILSMPVARRRRYVGMITESRLSVPPATPRGAR